MLCLALYAQEDLFKEENATQSSYAKNKDLKELFNSKFPVSDYIYKAGIRESENENAQIQELLNMDEKDRENNRENNVSKDVKDNNLSKALEAKQKLEQLRNENKALQNSMVYDENARIKKLLRDSILASRNSEIKDFSNDSRFGNDGFSNQKSIDISTNEHRLYRMIRAGRLIPATLTTAISSDLSGIVTAQVEQDIYAAMGQAVLIPRGSKAIGFYQNDNKIGQNRLEIKWREIITPQGINILLTDAIVADNMGMSGAIGALNNKYFERYGIAYGISTLTNALLLTISSKVDKGNNQYTQELYSNAKSDVGTIVDDIIQQQSQIKPTIEIKAGSRIYIVPTQHMWFSKPKNKEVLMKYFIEE
ncbi:DNA type IV secretion system protein ComB10 [Campylobacter cuniculorum]|nr:DNA type IV secretion system protein ComB10 [Campylobacter cuniculorum]